MEGKRGSGGGAVGGVYQIFLSSFTLNCLWVEFPAPVGPLLIPHRSLYLSVMDPLNPTSSQLYSAAHPLTSFNPSPRLLSSSSSSSPLSLLKFLLRPPQQTRNSFLQPLAPDSFPLSLPPSHILFGIHAFFFFFWEASERRACYSHQ